jgi:hypothetical protein
MDDDESKAWDYQNIVTTRTACRIPSGQSRLRKMLSTVFDPPKVFITAGVHSTELHHLIRMAALFYPCFRNELFVPPTS